MPLTVEVDGEPRVVPMTRGRGEIELRPDSHVLIDPDNIVLRQMDFIDAWKASQTRN
jgi:hypothetical protein